MVTKDEYMTWLVSAS